jgi:hypothetical protein
VTQTAVIETEGDVPMVVPAPSLGRGFRAKLEGHNLGGVKDCATLHVAKRARERGDLRPGGMIVESTSGTLGLGFVLAGITYGHPVTLVTTAVRQAARERGEQPIADRRGTVKAIPFPGVSQPSSAARGGHPDPPKRGMYQRWTTA